MKKLMTVIAAVAMSFGLFAADVATSTAIPHFISFEAADSCVDDNGKLQKDGWAGDASVIDLVGGYVYSGADARRDDGFADKGVAGKNVKCLKLETGKEVVTCTLADSTKDIFFDQVVKFTGYEEPPTVTEGKIAVWMSAIEADDQAETPVPGETNLYITCASIALNGEVATETINLGEYDIDAWHRVTIKSLGNIMADGNRAGFIVYIDGVQAKSIDGIVAEKYLADFAKSYNNSGLLFPALAEGDVATVAYQGIGELDDVAIDDQGPEFARFVEGTVAQIPGATLLITDENEEEIPVTNNKFQAAPGSTITLTYTADTGKFLTGGKETWTSDQIITQDNKDFTDLVKDIEAKTKVASYLDEAGEDTFAASLQEALDDGPAEGEVTLLTDEVLTAKLVIPADFGAGTITLGENTITLAADQAVGIDILADGVTIEGGTIASALEANVAGSKAINIPNKDVSLSGVAINAAHYEYAIYANCDDDAKAAGATLQEQLAWLYNEDRDRTMLDCDSVTITGNGSLFHVEGMIANLTDCSATRDANELFANEAHRAAVYSAVNADTTIDGEGSYTHVNALQSGNLGGTITVDSDSEAAFNGDIKSFMEVGAHPELEEVDDYQAQFYFYGGTYDGSIVFVDPTARELDLFQKDDDVEITAPAGYKWDEDDGILVPCDYVVTVQAGGVEKKYEDVDKALADVEAYTKANPTETVLVTFDQAVTKAGEYAFAEGATITITNTKVMDSDQYATSWALDNGDVTFLLPVGNYKAVSLEDDYTLTFAGTIGEHSAVVASTLTVPTEGKIDLSATASVTTKSNIAAETFTVPAGYKLDVNKTGDWYEYSAVELETWTVTIGEYDTTQVATFDANPKTVREDAESKTITLTATFQDGYELDYFTVGGESIDGNTFTITKSVTVGVVAKSTQQGWPEEGDPTIIDKTAAEAFEGKIPTVLAGVPAQKFTVWAKKAGLDFATCTPADVNVDAYLLDCTPAEVEAEKAKAVSAIEITSITFDGENWVITSGTYGEDSAYGKNAKVHFEEVTIEGADTTNAKFWQATLVPDETPAN